MAAEVGLFRSESARPVAHGPASRERRRLLLRWLGWGTLGALAAEAAVGIGAVLWPRVESRFGATIGAGRVDEYAVGEVKVFAEAQTYVVRVPEGFLAFWWRCTRDTCTVAWRPDAPAGAGWSTGPGATASQRGRFQCPCCGSAFDRYGALLFGPAPRPLDRFALRIEPDGRILVDTGAGRVWRRGRATVDEVVRT